jgi:hypothetical protein
MARSPLFDIYDPYGTLGAERLEDLMPPEEKDGLLRGLANMGASGLSAFGYLLDTPGAFVRGLLAGDPLSVFGTSDDRVTGRELLRQYGLVGEEDTWGNFAGGLGAEVLLDPLTYASLGLSALLGQGSKTAAFRAAAKAGITPDDITLAARNAGFGGPAEYLRRNTPLNLIESAGDDQAVEAARRAWQTYGGTDELLNAPLARSHRISFPGFGDGAADLYGQTFGDFAARTSDRLRGSLFTNPYTGPAMRTAQASFDSRVQGFDDADSMWMGRQLTEAEQINAREVARQLAEIEVPAARDIGEDIFRSTEFRIGLRDLLENQSDRIPQNVYEALSSDAGRRYVQAVTDLIDRQPDIAAQYGLRFQTTRLPNEIAYAPRQLAEIDSPRVDPRFAPRPTRPPRGFAVADIGQGAFAQRETYNRAFPTWVLDAMNADAGLQAALRDAANSGPTRARAIIDDWLATNARITMRDGTERAWLPQGVGPFDYLRDGIDPNDLLAGATDPVAAAYVDLADSLRRTPLQAGEQGLRKYGDVGNDLSSYLRNMGQRNTTANLFLDQLALPANRFDRPANLVPGGQAYTPMEALQALGGFDVTERAGGAIPALQILADRAGLTLDQLQNVSFPKDVIDRWNQKIVGSRAPREARGLVAAWDAVTDRFKTLALASPSRHMRDLYSGQFAAATQGAFDPLLRDQVVAGQVAGGNYRNLPARLRGTPMYERAREEVAANPSLLDPIRNSPRFRGLSDDQLLDELLIRRWSVDAGGVNLTSQSVADELGVGAGNLNYRENFPGGAGGLFTGVFNKPLTAWRTWNPYAVRGAGPNPNMLLDLSDRTASMTDAMNRVGTYLTRIRRGDSPLAAKRTADISQVLYSPENFTEFERRYLTRLFPFYRFTRGITPLIFQELTEKPAGLMGQSIRAVNRLTEPSPDRFVPEHLRQSTAIAIDPSTPLLGLQTPGVTRYLDNIDLPQEGLLNLVSPGVGNTLAGRFADAIQKTGSNILGQSNPLLKGPLEMVLNRQFYSGRQLSDLYSTLEAGIGPWGRPLEQILANAPGGSRALGLYRNYLDDRISPSEKAAKFLINTLTGVKFQDVDQDRTMRLAARTTLNQLLDQAPGMSTFENLSIKPEDIQRLSPEESRQYLLYRILQAEASRRRREQARQNELDPLAALGVR